MIVTVTFWIVAPSVIETVAVVCWLAGTAGSPVRRVMVTRLAETTTAVTRGWLELAA